MPDERPSGPPTEVEGSPGATARPDDGTLVHVPTRMLPPRPAALPTVPGYEILDLLGRGGMGVVYLARQQGLNRLVALKMILAGGHAGAEELDRFQAEAEAIARVRHPNIVQVYAVGSHDGLPFFALEYCGGGTLSQRLASGPHDPGPAAALGVALARAVHAAHEAGIVHRDIKPANVLLHADGTPKVTDFGLAKYTDTQSDRTRTGAVMGTPAYMAPEQAAGRGRQVGPRTDVYSLGALLYECLTGRPPFTGEGILDTLERVKTCEPGRPSRLRPGVPRDLEAVVLQCLEKDPERRYASAAELADDLERWRNGEPVHARRQDIVYRLAKRLRRHRRLAAFIGLLAVLVVLIWLGLADAGLPAPGGEGVRRWADRHGWSIFRPVPTDTQLRAAAAGLRRTFADYLLHEVPAREGWVSAQAAGVEFQPTDAWGQSQLAASLFSAPETELSDLRPLLRVQYRAMFEPDALSGTFVPGFGWPAWHDGQPSNEATAYAQIALARALGRPGLVPPGDRPLVVERLGQVQAVLEASRAAGVPGGWNLFARQEDRTEANLYISVLVCQGLLDLRDAGLGWQGSETRRDERLAETASWLIGQFDGRGWTTPGRQVREINDGLTLAIFGALLRAEEAGMARLPLAILEQIPRHLAHCRTRPLNYPIDVAMFSTPFRNPKGELVARPQRSVRMVWQPFAIDCTARWLRRLERTGAPRDELAEARRVLGHLLVDLGPDAVNEAKSGYSYVVAETLLALSVLPPG